jgi:anti-sigma factor RsiW
MTCAEVSDRLDDYVDGSLSEAEFQEVELHLAGCRECREEERALRRVLAEAAALPRVLEPPRDLWPEIADRISRVPQQASFGAGRGTAWRWGGLAAAAAVVLALAATLRTSGTPAPLPVVGDGTSVAALPVNVALEAPGLAQAEVEYGRASRQLLDALNARRSTLSPETLRAVDANLQLIDAALDQIHEALKKDPGSAALARLLTTTHQRKIDLLRRATKAKA